MPTLGRVEAGGRTFTLVLAAMTAALCVSWSGSARADESQWIQRSPSTPPSARWDASIVYDANSDRLVLFGGQWSPSSGQPITSYNDVWVYSLATRQWSQISPGGPLPALSSGHTAIYDPTRDRMVVFGGNVSGVYALSLGATPTWSVLSTTGTPPNAYYKQNHVAIYDPVNDQMVIAGGFLDGSTWKLTFSNNAWQQMNNAWIPFGEHHGSAVYDPVHQHMLYFGGWSYSYALLCQGPAIGTSNYVWSLDLTQPSPSWIQLPTAPWQPRGEIASFWDSIRNRVIIYGGVGYSEHCFYCTVCGGQQRSMNEPPFGDVWTMNVATNAWTQLAPTGGPPAARGHHVLAYDPTRDEVTMFGGGNYITDDSHVDCLAVCQGTPIYTYRNDTWSFKPDAVAPATIYLNASGGCYDHIFATWTAPGDDGMTGTATAYDLRWSTTTITDANFGGATSIPTPAPQPAGSQEQVIVYVPRCGTALYYAIKARDEAGNWSAISNSPSARPACPRPPIMCEDARAGLAPPPEVPNLPAALELAAPTPNPVGNEGLRIQFGVPAGLDGAEYDLSVFDLVGRRVATVDRGQAAQGYRAITWNLRSQDGSRVARGMYFVRLRVGPTTLTQRFISVR